MKKQNEVSTNISEPTNGASATINIEQPYTVTVQITGSADFLFHRWNCEAVEEKARAAKNSRSKKTDDLESYVYRLENGNLAIPGEYLRQAIIGAAKFRPDPRSPRKSAQDLFKAGIVALIHLCDTGTESWDYEDKRRAVIQRNGINRVRPALKAGWHIECEFLVNLPEYIDPPTFHEVVSLAGRLIGVGDFRPTFGRFQITKWEAQQ